jgi:hypothetical protein
MDDIHYCKHGKDSKVYTKADDDGNLITSNQELKAIRIHTHLESVGSTVSQFIDYFLKPTHSEEKLLCQLITENHVVLGDQPITEILATI